MAPWRRPWTVGVLLAVLGFVIVEAVLRLARENDAGKWGWGSALLVAVLGAFSLVRSTLRSGRAERGEPAGARWWNKVLAFVALFATIAVRSLTTGQSVRASFSYAALFLAVLLVVALVIYGVNRRKVP